MIIYFQSIKVANVKTIIATVKMRVVDFFIIILLDNVLYKFNERLGLLNYA
jgi:hypothetical protein